MQYVQENGYWSDDLMIISGDQATRTRWDKYNKNLNLFLKRKNEQFPKPPFSYSSLLTEKNEKGGLSLTGNVEIRKRSLSIPALGKHGSIISDPILSGTPRR